MTPDDIKQKVEALADNLLRQAITAAVKDAGQTASPHRIAQTAAWWHDALLERLGETAH